jgi:hypothetical protein
VNEQTSYSLSSYPCPIKQRTRIQTVQTELINNKILVLTSLSGKVHTAKEETYYNQEAILGILKRSSEKQTKCTLNDSIYHKFFFFFDHHIYSSYSCSPYIGTLLPKAVYSTMKSMPEFLTP